MALSNSLSGELAAGFHSSVNEARMYGVNGVELEGYTRRIDSDYSQIDALNDINAALEADKPVVDRAVREPEGTDFSAKEMTEIIAADDLKTFVRAEKDAAQAEAEASILMARADRFMSAARALNRMTIES